MPPIFALFCPGYRKNKNKAGSPFLWLRKQEREIEMRCSFCYTDYPPPYYKHSFTALRSRFDRWLASKAEAAGAVLIPSSMRS